MKKGLLYLAVVIFSVCTLGACKEEDDTYDAYANWPARKPSILLKSLPKPVIPLPGQRDSMANVGKNIATGVCSNRRPSRRMRPGR